MSKLETLKQLFEDKGAKLFVSQTDDQASWELQFAGQLYMDILNDLYAVDSELRERLIIQSINDALGSITANFRRLEIRASQLKNISDNLM